MHDRGERLGPAPAGGEIQESLTLTSLDQLKVISDPLRVRLLSAFCEGPRTTKQLAKAFGEKPTRLYHHVDALERVGLIRLVETRQVRGTVEKYYRAVAKRFRADSSLFGGIDTPGQGDLGNTVSVLLDTAAGELRALARVDGDLASGESHALVSFLEVRGGVQFVTELKDKLFKVLEGLEGAGDAEEAPADMRRFRLLLAYYPLDVGPPDLDQDR